MLHYLLELSDPNGHCLDVSLQASLPTDKLTVDEDGCASLTLWLPVWIPGSYLIREFSRNVLSFAALINGQPAETVKPAKNRWAVKLSKEMLAHNGGTLLLTAKWRVYAWDLSVRGAHFDQNHAFFNGTSVFLVPEGFEEDTIEVCVSRPTGEGLWHSACGLPQKPEGAGAVANESLHGCPALPVGGSLTFSAENYDALIDHPFEIGRLQLASFEACGVPHTFAVYGGDADLDVERICADLKPICEAQIRLFEPESSKAPFEQYFFMLHATDSGYGGLEHRNSTALLCSRGDLPQKGVSKPPEGYEQFMGLCSHEYFHSWNVKRIKPAAFVPYDLHQETYTRLLWVFEGFTSYYDDLMMARSGFHDEKSYLKALCKSVAQVRKGPGRFVQPLSESSFEAWTKYYRQDENAPNAISSYYTKGALTALCIDLTVRKATQGQKSLDDVMRHLWRKHGQTGIGVPEGGMAHAIHESTGVELSRELSSWVDGLDELPLEALLAAFGCELKPDFEDKRCSFGMVTQSTAGQLKIRSVYQGEAAHKAGLSAGDVLVAVEDRRLTEHELKRRMASSEPGTVLKISAFRADVFQTHALTLDAPRANSWQIETTTESPLPRPWFKA